MQNYKIFNPVILWDKDIEAKSHTFTINLMALIILVELHFNTLLRITCVWKIYPLKPNSEKYAISIVYGLPNKIVQDVSTFATKFFFSFFKKKIYFHKTNLQNNYTYIIIHREYKKNQEKKKLEILK